MENLGLLRAIEEYDSMKSDYELYWQLAFSPPSDFEEMAERSWQLNCESQLPIPVVALACRLCLETSTNQEAIKSAYGFLAAHGDDQQESLPEISRRLNLHIEPHTSEER